MARLTDDDHDEYQKILQAGLEEKKESTAKSEERQRKKAAEKKKSTNFFQIFMAALTAISLGLYLFPPFSTRVVTSGKPMSPGRLQRALEEFHQDHIDSLPDDSAAQPLIDFFIKNLSSQTFTKQAGDPGVYIDAIEEELRLQGFNERQINEMISVDPGFSVVIDHGD